MRKIVLSISLAIAVSVFMMVMSTGIQAADLVAHWNFDEGSGDTIADSSGNGNNGTINADTQWVDGKLGKALQFDGANAIANVPHSESLDFGDDFSFLFWVKTTQVKSNLGAWWNGGWITNKDLPGQADVTDWDTACVDGKIVFVTGNPETDVDDLLVSSVISDGEWHHIAVTRVRESGLKTLYVDGVVDASEVQGAGISVENDVDMTIGGHPAGAAHAFEGILDDLAIYTGALSQDEVVSNMNSGVTAVKPTGKLATAWGKIKD